MNPELFSRLFGYNESCVKVNTEGLTQEDSLIQPQPGGNCLNWILGHIVATRNLILELLGQDPIWSDKDAEPYKRGSNPIQNGKHAHSLDNILSDFTRSQEAVVSALKHKTVEDMAKIVDEETLGQKLAALCFHETYHIGQTGLLRRLAGKEGAIR